jgi:serine/threonine protein kinase/formylglycine-generating enzyme required for sulfatase activity
VATPSNQHFLKLAVTKGIIDRNLARELYRESERSGRDPSAIMLERGILSPYIADTLRADVAKMLGPRTIGGFRITGKLGEGGMGTVYRAVQVSVNRPVALKVLAENLTTNVEFTARFLREAYGAAKVAHANVVTVFDAGRDDKQLYMAMELVTGGDADQLMRASGGRLPERRALEIIRDAARGLGAIAKAGLIHRDIKPSNILLTDEGEGKLGDLGLARTEDGEDRRTRTGMILGTPAFMSPEQADGAAELDIRADIYSLGATLYTLLAGVEPFTGTSPYAIVGKLLTTPFPDPSVAVPGLSAVTTDLVLKATMKDRLQRFQTPLEFVAAIENALALLPRVTPDTHKAIGTDQAGTRHSTDLLPAQPPADSYTPTTTAAAPAGVVRPPPGGDKISEKAAEIAAKKDATARQAKPMPVKPPSNRGSPAVGAAAAIPPVTVGKAPAAGSEDDWDIDAEDARPTTSAVDWARPNLTEWGRSESIGGGGILILRKLILPGLLVAVLIVVGIVWQTMPRAPVDVDRGLPDGSPKVTPGPTTTHPPPLDAHASAHAAELRAHLAVLDQAAPLPADVAAALGDLANLAGASDASVARWRAKVAAVAQAKSALHDLDAVVDAGSTPSATQASTYNDLVAQVGRADPDVVRWSAAFAPRSMAWASATGHDNFGAWAEFTVNNVVQRLRWCPPGRFIMGCDDAETDAALANLQLVKPDTTRADVAAKPHEVILTTGFWLADSECTQALWQQVMGANPSIFQANPQRPVENVTWETCQDFLGKLNILVPGLHATLPSEARWEYACRAGTLAAIWTGPLDAKGANNAPNLDAIAWYTGNSGVTDVANATSTDQWTDKQYDQPKAATHPVKGKAANPWGLYDMLGNVAEWCADQDTAYPDGPVTDPGDAPDPGSQEAMRAVRGGAWATPGAARCRAAARFGFMQSLPINWVGMRICVIAAPQTSATAAAATTAAPATSATPDVPAPATGGADK